MNMVASPFRARPALSSERKAIRDLLTGLSLPDLARIMAEEAVSALTWTTADAFAADLSQRIAAHPRAKT